MARSGGGTNVERYRRLDAAFRTGDMDALRAELGTVDGFPNVIADQAMGACLPYAIYHAPLDLIEALLEAGADPNWPVDDGFPPLIAALTCSTAAPGATVRTDVHTLIEMLLAHGADVDQRGLDDFTPLHLAAAQGDLGAIDILLAHGADPNTATRIDDYETPLEVAAAAGHTAVVERLRPVTLRLVWDSAVSAGDIGALTRLIRAGHDIDTYDGYGQTALMRAAHNGQLDLVRWLISNGADLDHAAKFHLSALMLAVIAGHHKVARLLVESGADVMIRGSGAPGFLDKTAADLADDRGDQRLAAFIRTRAGAMGARPAAPVPKSRPRNRPTP